jgi:hypothetical protein
MKDIPSHGASLRSSVHFAQIGLGGSLASRNNLANTPSKTPL